VAARDASAWVRAAEAFGRGELCEKFSEWAGCSGGASHRSLIGVGYGAARRLPPTPDDTDGEFVAGRADYDGDGILRLERGRHDGEWEVVARGGWPIAGLFYDVPDIVRDAVVIGPSCSAFFSGCAWRGVFGATLPEIGIASGGAGMDHVRVMRMAAAAGTAGLVPQWHSA
jgi:hypothetical protein